MRDMDEAELRRRLLSYPDITEANIEDHLRHYTMRAIQKQTFLTRGFSNAMAERGLDKLGYQRPPGWHSVFFYPGSMRPRNRYVLLGIVIVTAVLLNGCVAVWGDSYSVSLKNPEAIMIEYDPVFVNMAKLGGIAQDHCQTWGRNAVATGQGSSNPGIATIQFACR